VVISLIPPLEAHLDGSLGTNIDTVHAAGAFLKADAGHDELAGVYFLELSRTHLGAESQDMGGADKKALAAVERVVALFIIYGYSRQHFSFLFVNFYQTLASAGKLVRSTMVIASCGHSEAHSPQPKHWNKSI
jgi:hypothetical protein